MRVLTALCFPPDGMDAQFEIAGVLSVKIAAAHETL
jgi:hypothetical protein